MRYRYNPYCSCARCRAHGYMGPAVLITMGVLVPAGPDGSAYWMKFHFTWPALLIVIGLIKLLEHPLPSTATSRASTASACPIRGKSVPPGTSGYPSIRSRARRATAAGAARRFRSPRFAGGPDDREVHNG